MTKRNYGGIRRYQLTEIKRWEKVVLSDDSEFMTTDSWREMEPEDRNDYGDWLSAEYRDVKREEHSMARHGFNPPLFQVRSVGPNQTEVTHGKIMILVSYETPVAVHVSGGGFYVTEKKWSPTTTRHINQWLSAHGAQGEVEKVPQVEIERMASSGKGPVRGNPHRGSRRVPSTDENEPRVDVWAERGEVRVTLYQGDDEVRSWETEEVGEMLEDGFWRPGKLPFNRDVVDHDSVIEHAQEMGLIGGD